jgi:hypothetical protein
MSTGSTSAYVGACRKDIPYPSVSHESVPSLIDNLVSALYGSITKTVVNRRVQWSIPCDPNNTATINNIPRNAGEGLLCYIIRALNLTGASGFVTANGVQTLSNKTLDASCSLLGAAAKLSGGAAGSIPYQTGAGITTFLAQGTAGQVLSCNGSGQLGWITNSTTSSSTNNVNGGTAGVVVYQTGVNTTGFTAAGTSGQVLVSNGTSSPTWSTNISGQAGSVDNGSVTPAKLSTGGPSWDTSGNVGIGTSSPTAKLDVAGNVKVSGNGILVLGRQTSSLEGGELIFNKPTDDTTGWAIDLYGQTNDGFLRFRDTTAVRLDINSSTGVINTNGNPITNCKTTAKAWVNFNGALTGTIAPRASYNVSSITKLGTGDYAVNFANNFADTSYSTVAMAGTTFNGYCRLGGYATSYVRISAINQVGPTAADSETISVQVFGN